MRKRTADLSKLFEIILAFNSETSYYGLLELILRKMMELTNADAGTLYIVDDKRLRFKIMRNIQLGTYQSAYDEINLPPVVMDEENIQNVAAYCAIKNEVVTIDDVYTSEQFNFSGPKEYDKITGYRTGSMLVLPLTTTEDEVIGVLQLMNAIDKTTGQFTSFDGLCDLSVLLALANISANALSNIIYAREVEDMFSSFVRVITAAIDERSPHTTNHTKNVANYCEHAIDYMRTVYPVGHVLHMSENVKQQVIVAAFLHDMGKLITPLEIMDKGDRLGSRGDIIFLRFALRRSQLEAAHLRGELTAAQYKKEAKALEESRKLVEEVNKANSLSEETLAQVRGVAALTYQNENGESMPIFEEADMDAITVPTGTLTESERRIMREHVDITGRLLDRMGFGKNYKQVPFWARSHHELSDGSGYPLGLKESELSPQICLLTISDIFEALAANDRPYKAAMPIDKAISTLQGMGKEGKLNEELVERFVESLGWKKKD